MSWSKIEISRGSSRNEMFSPCARATARSMTFSNSRTLPGHSYWYMAAVAPVENPFTLRLNSRLYFAMKCSTRRGISSRRCRNGGSVMGTTFRR